MADEGVMKHGPEMAAVRKVLTAMAGYDAEAEQVPADDIQLAIEAAERFNDLAQTVTELKQVVDTDMGTLRYEQMTKKDKVRQLRSFLLERAKDGRPYMEYDNVITLFNGHPSPGHAYDLMKLAANADGFEYQQPNDDRPNRIVVNLGDVNDDAAFHAANKEVAAEPP